MFSKKLVSFSTELRRDAESVLFMRARMCCVWGFAMKIGYFAYFSRKTPVFSWKILGFWCNFAKNSANLHKNERFCIKNRKKLGVSVKKCCFCTKSYRIIFLCAEKSIILHHQIKKTTDYQPLKQNNNGSIY